MNIELKRVYYVRGSAPGHWARRSEVKDPPTSGYSHALVIVGDKRSTILCPFTLSAFQVSNKCSELDCPALDLDKDRMAKVIVETWESCVRLGFQRDFGVAAMVLAEFGHAVPKFLPAVTTLPDGSREEEKTRGGKPVDHDALKPCNPASKRAEVARFFMADEPQSLHEAMAKLGLTRSGVLSHLFTLNKDHGVGYDLVRDCAILIVPEGFDLFAWVAPVRAEKPVPMNDDGTPKAPPKKRTSGKPIREEALKPIPEPGKRAQIARIFLNWAPVIDGQQALDIDRSAVLSHLFTINKENGLGYELSEDGSQARLLIPDGHEVFCAKQSRAKKSAPTE
ncbi:MAG: hypothetical protein WC982_05345 [Advenella sp.]